MNTIPVAVIITAAGSSTRFGTGEKKEYLPLKSSLFPNQIEGTVLSCSTEAFLQCILENPIYKLSKLVITIPQNSNSKTAETALFASKFVRDTLQTLEVRPIFVEGSITRQSSIYKALEVLHNILEKTENTIVLIHDAARPFLTTQIVKNVLNTTRDKGAAVPAIQPVDTQKEVDSHGKILRHLQRASLGAVQTPQGFRFAELFQAHSRAQHDNKTYTDDTEIWAKYSGDVYAVEGSPENLKVTFKKDMMQKEMEYRTGLGYDLHKLVENRPLILGGIHIPFSIGEEAHSDGDVLLHAITDCLLGAAALSDIGELFPPQDEKWKNANSATLLKAAWNLVKEEGWQLQNLDCVIQIEKPKFLPWREQVRESIASILSCEKERIFVKAKTGEGLGDIGESRAVSVQAICLLKK